ncbi:MAG TPA: tetratricopeptide repeat protein [Burkholderiales bacterium]|nr:tetratricopeptide repeat protein [Burkholderiales bacterium]
MATFDLEEQEQLDALKDWWKHNSVYVFTAVAAIIIAASGVAGWRHYQANQAEEVAKTFAQFEKTAEAKDAKKTREAAVNMMEKFSGSPYAAQAALTAAQQSFDANDLDAAQASLKLVVDKAKSPQLQSVARLRLGAILLDQKKYDEALKLLDDNKDPAFLSLTADLKGDIYAVQGKVAEAQASYNLAIEKAQDDAVTKQLAQIKLDALGSGK